MAFYLVFGIFWFIFSLIFMLMSYEDRDKGSVRMYLKGMALSPVWPVVLIWGFVLIMSRAIRYGWSK